VGCCEQQGYPGFAACFAVSQPERSQQVAAEREIKRRWPRRGMTAASPALQIFPQAPYPGSIPSSFPLCPGARAALDVPAWQGNSTVPMALRPVGLALALAFSTLFWVEGSQKAVQRPCKYLSNKQICFTV